MCLVDLPTGRLGLTETDWDLRLPLPLKQVRSYRSDNSWRGDLGIGWGHTWGVRLWHEEPGGLVVRLPDGRRAQVALPTPGGVATNDREQVAVRALRCSELPWADVQGQADECCYLVQLPETPTLVFSDRQQPTIGFRWLGMADRSSNWVRIMLDHQGRPERVLTPWQRSLRFVHTPEGLLSEMWLESPSNPFPGIRLVQYTYGREGDLTGVEDAAGWRRYRYHDHLLVNHVDRIGGACTSEFDSHRRCVTTGGPQGTRRRQYAYDPKNHETRSTDSLGATSVFRSNDQEMVTEVIDPAGGSSSFEYDDAYRVIKATDQLGAVTQFVYGGNGALLSKISPTGQADCVETDPRGEVLRHLSPAGVPRLEVIRGPLGRVLSMRQAGLGQTLFEWNSDGTLASKTTPSGQVIRMGWDAAHRIYTETDDRGLVLRRSFDVLGKVIQYEDALGHVTKIDYDPAGHLKAISQPDGAREEFRIDAEGDLMEVIDAKGARIEYLRDSAGNVTGKRVAGEVVGRAEYDLEGRVTRVSGRDGLNHEFTYDLRGLVTQQKFPDGRVERYAYDANSRLVEFVDPRNDIVRATYDAAGKLSHVLYPDQTEKSIERNEDGRWTEVRLGQAISRREFDERGRVFRQQQDDFWFEYEYDDADRTVSATASDGRRVKYAYNELGKLAQFTVCSGRWRNDLWQQTSADRVHQFEYDPLGSCTAWHMPGDKHELRKYDERGRLIRQQILVGTREIISRSYEYDPTSRLTGRIDSLRGSARFGYDAWDRLTDLQDGARHEQFHYGLAGDRSGAQISFQPGHRVERWGDARFVYDQRGFVVRRQQGNRSTEFDYTYQGLLKASQSNDGLRLTYDYDGLSRLIRKTKNGQETVYRWNQNQLWSVGSAASSHVEFVSLPEEHVPREQTVNGQTCTVHTDHRGRVMELIDQEGNIVWKNTHDVWGGGRAAATDELVSWFEYPGQVWDGDLQLYYHRYRIYDPLTGHFMTPDPIGLWGGFDAYTYPQDPVNQADPMGLGCVGKANEPTLYRGDSRPPDKICKEGFEPQDATQTPLQHMNGGCGWVSTAYEASTAEDFAHSGAAKYGGNPYVYVISNPGCGVEVECDPEVQQWQKDVGLDDDDTEHEVAFNKAIPGSNNPGGSNILGYYDARVGPSSFQIC